MSQHLKLIQVPKCQTYPTEAQFYIIMSTQGTKITITKIQLFRHKLQETTPKSN